LIKLFKALILFLCLSTASEAYAAGRLSEKIQEYRFRDGTRLKVHYTDTVLRESGESRQFPQDVLDAAVSAYQTIVEFQGFSTPGYSFASPDKTYAYDPDRTIDIYLGNPEKPNPYPKRGFDHLSFKDAPCFDTIQVSDTKYQAVILLPGNYKEFIKNWERINPSSLGSRNVWVDLRGTLIHEMLHVVLFYYNKNLNKECDIDRSHGVSRDKKVDWYVEGLARYFETFAGAKHDFFSRGFKETLPDKIRFSRGGSNYFMRYPDQAFTDLRYENALFWRFIDYQKGMGAIERMSRDLRAAEGREGHRASLEKVSELNMKELLSGFAMAILFKDFGLKEDGAYLKEVARTRLVYKNSGLYLKDGFGGEEALGPNCRTDWIGEWEQEKAPLGDLPVAGDNTTPSDVSGWATDFYEITRDPSVRALPWLGITLAEGGAPLSVQVVMASRGGSLIKKQLLDIQAGQTQGLDLQEAARRQGLRAADIEKIFLLVTNIDESQTAHYELRTRP